MKISDLYDGIVDEFGIPAQSLMDEKKEVCDYLSNLSKDDRQKLELHVRRLHSKNSCSSFYPTVLVLTTFGHGNDHLYLGSSIFLSVQFINLPKFFS